MQDLSFVFRNQQIDFGLGRCEIMVYSFTNAYSLDPDKTEIIRQGDLIQVSCGGLLTNGGQTAADGSAAIHIRQENGRCRFDVRACIADSGEEIRSVKVCVSGLKAGNIINLIDSRPMEITEKGVILNYPEGWRTLGTPLVILEQPAGDYLYFRSLDNEVRRKVFTFRRDRSGLSAELIFEENAPCMSNSLTVPTWEIGYAPNVKSVYDAHRQHVESAYGLTKWEERRDVPDWARNISLIASIHGQHWTGHIFRDYDAILNDLKRLSQKIDPSRILAYLPGWEGRYYWKYGNYGPDERMGGAAGLHRLADGARQLGVHLMPMYGINIAGIHHPGFMDWGDVSEARSPSGNIRRGSVDWDGSRHYDHGSGRTMNPGAPKWQNRLARQITCLSKEYGFDAAFLDIAAFWENDPNHSVYQGVCDLTSRLHENLDDFLIAGEGWYDALSAVIPLLQSGHTDGFLHWHDDADAPFFDTYARQFPHLCLGDPYRFSTGVHEQGTNPQWRAPLRKGIIPTLTIVDGTLDNAGDRVDQILSDANQYAEKYL